VNQVKDIGTFEGVASGEDEDGHLHGGDLIDQGFAFVRTELIGMGDGLGGGAAMLADQITRLRDFPDGQKRSFVEIQPAAGGNAVHGLHEGLRWNRGQPDPGKHKTLPGRSIKERGKPRCHPKKSRPKAAPAVIGVTSPEIDVAQIKYSGIF
jgi:hypothetical protein